MPLLIGALAGGVMGAVLVLLLDSSGLPMPLELLLFLAAALLAWWIQIVVHEGGHLVCGLASGYTFSSFRIGSVMLLRQDGRLVLRRFSLPGTGGQCLLEPPEGDAPVLLYNLGGGLFNFLLSALAGALLLLPVPFLVRLLLVMLLVMGLFVGALNLIPMRVGGMANDGYNARMLGRTPQARTAFLAQMRINGAMARGVSLRDMPPEWFRLPEGADMGDPLVCSMAYLRASRLTDEGDIPAARAAVEELLEGNNGLLGLHRSELECEALFFELTGENRPQERERLYSRQLQKYIKATQKYLPSRYRLLYAWALLAQGDREKAEEYRAAFEKGAQRYPYPVEMEGERRLMELARRRAES